MSHSVSVQLIDALDLQQRLGVSLNTAYRKFKEMKKRLGKQRHQYVTNFEAAEDLGLSIEDFEKLKGW